MKKASDARTKLTICSVAFESHDFIARNYEMVSRLNETGGWQWLIVDNTPPGSACRFPKSDKRFTVIDGIDPASIDHPMKISMHHALGLAKALEHVDSRYVLFLDPDFYVVRRGWIDELIRHMEANGLSFFGAPYHPQWHEQYRYFPCLHFTLIDLEKVMPSELDFRPGKNLTVVRALKTLSSAPIFPKMAPGPILQAAYELSRLIWRLTLGRKRIGRTRDTGFQIFERYSSAPDVLHETLVPVFRPKADTGDAAHVFSAIAVLMEAILPDSLCYLPKRRDYYSELNFPAFGLPDLRSLGWEEFLWKNAPFGFHLHRHRHPEKLPDRAAELIRVQEIIELVSGKSSASR